MNEDETRVSPDGRLEQDRYEIRLAGHLHARWADRFEGMSIGHASDGTTVLAGPVVDQAALHGVLRQIRDVGLTLISIVRVEPESTDKQIKQQGEKL